MARKRIAKVVGTQQPDEEGIKQTVQNWDQVANFLQELGVQVAVVPNSSGEVVKSCTVLYAFLRNRAEAVRQQYPQMFKPAGPELVETKKKK